MKITTILSFLLFTIFLSNQLTAQNVCIIKTSKRGHIDGEYGIDSLTIIFHYPSLLSALQDEASGDPTPYTMYEEQLGYERRYEYLIQNDTLYQYYPAVKKISKPIMYLKDNEIYLGSYFNQSNGAESYVFDNTLVGTIYGNDTDGYSLGADAGLSDMTTIATCKENCAYGLMAAYSYIFVASELMDE